MRDLMNSVLSLKIWSDDKGQDLIEYALVAGFIAIGVAATLPSVTNGLLNIFSQVQLVLNQNGPMSLGL
jgi:Flp pilus assembly pilin Flp